MVRKNLSVTYTVYDILLTIKGTGGLFNLEMQSELLVHFFLHVLVLFKDIEDGTMIPILLEQTKIQLNRLKIDC